MKIVKVDKPNNEEALRVFGVNFKQEKMDDDITLWTQEQLKNKLIEKGVVLLREMGQDVQGKFSCFFNICFIIAHYHNFYSQVIMMTYLRQSLINSHH